MRKDDICPKCKKQSLFMYEMNKFRCLYCDYQEEQNLNNFITNSNKSKKENKEKMTEETIKNKPISFTQGNLKINQWTNIRKVNDIDQTFKSYTFEKFYKNSDDKWTSTQNFNLDELLKIKELITSVFNNVKELNL